MRTNLHYSGQGEDDDGGGCDDDKVEDDNDVGVGVDNDGWHRDENANGGSN